MSNPGERTILVAGAGLAGALAACYLGRAGYRVRLFERRGDPRRLDVDAGRSINLALSIRGLAALEGVDLAERVLARAVPMRGRRLHDIDGALTFQPYGTDPGQHINSVSRLGLNVELIEAADEMDNVELCFGQRCLDVDLDAPALMVRDEESGEERRIECDALIGADGAFSAIRARMQRKELFDYDQSYLEHGYKELTIPAGESYGGALETNALHIWPRGGYMMIALPNRDGSFTCTLFWPFKGPNGFEGLDDAEAVRRRFERDFSDAVPLMPRLTEEYFENPTSSLVTIRCRPWNHGRTLLIGDASHAIVPFYGQGANAAFEDCRRLAAQLEQGGELEQVFARFAQERKPNTDALAQLAIDNFVVMRDSVNSPLFRARGRFEKWLHRLLGDRYIPLYIMVTFSKIPYAEARRRADSQWSKVRRFALAAAFAATAALIAGLLLE